MNSLQSQTVAIIGYGAQGRSHALNLRDSGIQLKIGQRSGPGFDRATADDFHPLPIPEAVAASDIVCIMLPDERHGDVFRDQIQPHLQPQAALMVCHGFSLHFGLIQPEPAIPAFLVAPKGAGHRVRSAYQEGAGVPCLVAVATETPEAYIELAYDYAAALGCRRDRTIRTTFAEETETDLFGEQVVLCGGVIELMKKAFQVLVDAGYQPEVAYFECVHELKLVIDLVHRGGLAQMRDHISNTAEFGGFLNGPRLVDQNLTQRMQDVLRDIQSGQFARQWTGHPQRAIEQLQAFRQAENAATISAVGQRVLELDQGCR